VFVPGVGTTLPAETPAKPKHAPKAAKSVEPKALVAVKSISPSAAGRLGDIAGGELKGYIVRWPKGGADLLQKVAGEGAAWLVRCNAHGTTTPADSVKVADALGRKSERQVWCGECAAEAAAKAK
jgi:hypothetical protein